jgi:hypothetical protein
MTCSATLLHDGTAWCDRGDVVDRLGHRGAGGSDNHGSAPPVRLQLGRQVTDAHATYRICSDLDQGQLLQAGAVRYRIASGLGGVDDEVGVAPPGFIKRVVGRFGGTGGDVALPIDWSQARSMCRRLIGDRGLGGDSHWR